jgi:hypothetical protein
VPFARLHVLLPEVARTETRSLIVSASAGRPSEHFAFFEMYCDEPGCDCRRVVFQVISTTDPSQIAATISWGWEPDGFYRAWAGFPLSADDLEELRGPGLMRLNPQSSRAQEMLVLCRSLLADAAYRERIVRHYRLFRELIDGGQSAAPARPREMPVRWRGTSRKRRRAERKASRKG